VEIRRELMFPTTPTARLPFGSAVPAALLLDAVPQAIVATDQEGRITFWNRFAEVLYGWTAAEAVGRLFVDVSPPSGSDVEVGIPSTLSSGAPTSGPSTIERRDGTSLSVWVTASSIPLPDGRPGGVVGTAVEVPAVVATELYATKEDFFDAVTAGIRSARVEASEQMYRTLFDQAADAFMVTSGAGAVEVVNDAWLRLFGYDRSEAMQLRLEDLYDPEQIKRAPPDYERLERLGSTITHRSGLRKDGSLFPTENSATWFSRNHILISVRDLSAQVRADEKLRQSEAKYRSVVENAGDGIVMADRNGRVIDGNRRALELVGYTWEEARGLLLADFLTPEDAKARPPNLTIQHGPVVRQRTLLRKDGTEVQVEVNATVSPEGLYIAFLRDLSERDQADRELKASEENYRRIVEFSPDAIIVHLAGTIVYANDAAARLVGAADRGEVIGRSAVQFLDPEYRERALERIDRVLRLGLTAPLTEERLKRLDGGTVMVETVALPFDYQGKRAVQVIVRDITARTRAEEALRSSEERYRGIVERATDAMYLVSDDGMLTDANPATLAITGWSLDEILSRRIIDLIHPDDRHRAETFFLSSLEETQREAEVFRILKPSGDYIYLEMMITPVVQESGRRAVFGIGRDITAARRAEQQIRFQASLLAHVRNAVIASDHKGFITYWNHHAELLYGWNAEEVVGRHVDEVMKVPEATALQAARAELFATGRWEGETTVRRRNGRELSVHLVLATIVDETGSVSGVIGSSFDLTTLHETERELEQARRFSSLGRLAATVAHEFNNVMMGIYPFAEIIGRNPDPLMGRASLHVTQALQRGKQITQDILKFARASEPLLAPVDVGAFLRDALEELRTIGGAAVTIELETSGDCYMMADRHQMQQVLSNLVANARDAMHAMGAISITASHCGDDPPMRKRAQGDMVRISVRDTGCGIPLAEQSLIFEPLFTTKRSTGTGLGLAVVHQIITRHGGEVIVESTPDVGTTFHLLIPKSSAPAVLAIAPESLPLSRPSRLLLVEDDPHVAVGLMALLEIEGIEVSLVTLGRDAVGEIERFAPDAVILDVGLPDIDGVTVSRQIAERWPDLPVVFSTGHGDENLLEEALRRPHVGYLLKPYGVEELLEVLARII
jgi:two-component system cell cycle sensor histidine kinase/response regulator CckA